MGGDASVREKRAGGDNTEDGLSFEVLPCSLKSDVTGAGRLLTGKRGGRRALREGVARGVGRGCLNLVTSAGEEPPCWKLAVTSRPFSKQKKCARARKCAREPMRVCAPLSSPHINLVTADSQ